MGGCCVSRGSLEDAVGRLEGTSAENPVPRGGNKPFTKKGITWESDSLLTPSQLKRQRDAFWDTAPTYEGRLEIWQALRCASESDDLDLAQAILDSANVTLPTGNLADGCYDELGNRYLIPPYCIIDPTNLIKSVGDSQEGTSTDRLIDDTQGKLSSDLQNNPRTSQQNITIRISNTAKDVDLKINRNLDTIATLRQKLYAQEGLDVTRINARFFFLGKLLDDKTHISDIKIVDGQVLQALISERS
ncbi:hypothetical protein G9A89_009768 [Geosiphon pyriformis]|nr:hypothetical protein G9A89_009768 [Geosiphon pyriformis]